MNKLSFTNIFIIIFFLIILGMGILMGFLYGIFGNEYSIATAKITDFYIKDNKLCVENTYTVNNKDYKTIVVGYNSADYISREKKIFVSKNNPEKVIPLLNLFIIYGMIIIPIIIIILYLLKIFNVYSILINGSHIFVLIFLILLIVGIAIFKNEYILSKYRGNTNYKVIECVEEYCIIRYSVDKVEYEAVETNFLDKTTVFYDMRNPNKVTTKGNNLFVIIYMISLIVFFLICLVFYVRAFI